MTKPLFAVCFAAIAVFAAAAAGAAEKPAAAPPAASVKGEVLEVLDARDFTYLRLKTAEGEKWAGIPSAPVKPGSQVTIENAVPMRDFKSKALERTFPLVMLGNLPGTAKNAPMGSADLAAAHGGVVKPAVDLAGIKVAKATGANARTVAEIATKSAELKDKPVLVRGKVVKFNGGIMDRNWVHLRDGSGSEADKSNDILVTTREAVMVGQVVTFRGIVRTDREFGSGYSYKVMVEDGALQK